jgi:hypothetical protein
LAVVGRRLNPEARHRAADNLGSLGQVVADFDAAIERALAERDLPLA